MSISGRVKGYGAGGRQAHPSQMLGRCQSLKEPWGAQCQRWGSDRRPVASQRFVFSSSAAACRRFRQICSLFRWMFQWNSMLRPELHQILPLICYFLPARLRWAMGSARWVDLPVELWLIGAKMKVLAEQRVPDELYWAKGKFSVLIVLLLLIQNFWIFSFNDIGNCYR